MSLLSRMLYMAKISDWGGAMKKAVTCRAKREKAKCYGKKCLNRKNQETSPFMERFLRQAVKMSSLYPVIVIFHETHKI